MLLITLDNGYINIYYNNAYLYGLRTKTAAQKIVCFMCGKDKEKFCDNFFSIQ